MTAPRRARLLSPAMLGVASGAVLVPLNSTMLAVALPSVMGEFSIGPETVSSLVTLYLGAVTVALPASGSLGDRYGQRRVFLAGVLAFAISSLIAAVAPSFELLALARVLQAVSGALVSTASVALVRAMSPPDRRGAAFGTFDMLVSTSAAIGPFIGGLLVGAFGWRSLFVIAVPVALFAAVMVGFVVRPDRALALANESTDGTPRPVTSRPIDVPGLVLLATVLIALLVAIRGAGDGGAGSLAVIAVVPLLLVFLRFELASDHPAVDPRLFTIRPFAAAVLGVLGATVVLHGAFILVPLLIEELLHGNAQTAGLVLLAISALGAIAAPIGGRLSDRYGRRLPVVAGSLCLTAGLVALWWFAAGSPASVIGVLLGVVGLGLGLSGSPRQAAAMDTIPAERVGMAAGTYYTGRYLGGVLGASLAGAVLGATVTGAGVTLGFGLLAIVGAGVVAVSFGLPDRAARRPAGAAL
ncbi:MAG: MFS transporter [Chloroflexota bacterium]